MKLGCRLGLAAVFACLSGAVLPSVAAAYPVGAEAQSAMSLLAKKDYRGAVEAANRALKASPHDPVALATRGNAYIELGDYEHALADHDAVLAQVGDSSPSALNNACWVRALANTDLDRARRYCDTAVAMRRSLADYDTRGFLDLRQGKLETAKRDYDSALRIRPRTASSLYARGVVEIRLGETAKGQADMAAAVRLQADIADVFARRGLGP